MPSKPTKPPAPPKAAITKLAKQLDDALATWQAKVRPWMLEMENHDAANGRHVSAMRREEVRDTLSNRIHEAHFRTRQLRDAVQSGDLLRQQASDYEEGVDR